MVKRSKEKKEKVPKSVQLSYREAQRQVILAGLSAMKAPYVTELHATGSMGLLLLLCRV